MNKLKLFKAMTIVLAIMLAATVAYAVFLVQRQVHNYGSVKYVGDFMLYQDEACTVPLTEINWGSDLVRGGATQECYCYLKIADGSDPMKFVWNVTGIPNGIQFWMYWLDSIGDGHIWNMNTETTFDGHNTAGTVVKLDLLLNVGTTAAAGDFSFDVTFYGYTA
jgi:hypothetical protein